MQNSFRLKKYILTVAFSLFLFSSLANSFEDKVVAIVNGEAISSVQLNERVRIVMSSAGLKDTPEVRNKITRESLEILINETLQAQEAKEKGVALTDEELKISLNDLEKRNGVQSGGFKKFIESKGLSYQGAVDQIKASLLWKKTIQRILKQEVVVTDKEIQQKAKSFSNMPKKVFVNISEIIVPLDFDNKDGSKNLANKIVSEARSGKNFAELAAKYSAGKTAKKGGNVGWLESKDVVPTLRAAVEKTKVGSVSDPVSIDQLYVIIKVNEQKIIDPANDKEMLRERVLMEKLDRHSRRYVKELRQKAFIEKKV